MCSIAEGLLPEVQALPIIFLNVPMAELTPTFIAKHDAWFGPDADYDRLDAVVFCIRRPTILKTVGREWRLEGRARFVRRTLLDRTLLSFGRSRFGALSLASDRLREWIRFTVSPIATTPLIRHATTVRRVESGLRKLEDISIEKGIPFGFLWLPDIRDVRENRILEGAPLHTARSVFSLAMMVRSVPFADPTSNMGGENAYFPTDGHPNEKGQRVLGHALANVISRLRAR
jgi:hypothetical protein